MYKQFILTKQWNYNNFVQILYSYLRYTDRLLDEFFLLVAVILSNHHENPRRKDLVTEKSTQKYCVRDITFSPAHSPYIIFLSFFSTTLSLLSTPILSRKKRICCSPSVYGPEIRNLFFGFKC